MARTVIPLGIRHLPAIFLRKPSPREGFRCRRVRTTARSMKQIRLCVSATAVEL
jgi:hypothetical protein